MASLSKVLFVRTCSPKLVAKPQPRVCHIPPPYGDVGVCVRRCGMFYWYSLLYVSALCRRCSVVFRRSACAATYMALMACNPDSIVCLVHGLMHLLFCSARRIFITDTDSKTPPYVPNQCTKCTVIIRVFAHLLGRPGARLFVTNRLSTLDCVFPDSYPQDLANVTGVGTHTLTSCFFME